MKWRPFNRREWGMVAVIAFLVLFILGEVVANWLPVKADLAGWAGLAAAIAAFLAIFLAYFGFVETEKNNKREHRAYVRADVTRAKFILGSLKLEFEIENYGRTPATNLLFTANVYIVNSRRIDEVMVPLEGNRVASVQDRMTMPFLHPGKALAFEFSFDGPFGDQAPHFVEDGNATLVIELTSTYTDVFSQGHGEMDKAHIRGSKRVNNRLELARVTLDEA